MIPLLFTLLAASFAAPARPDAIPLTSEDQVRELCAALRSPIGSSELDPVETAARRHRAERLRNEAVSRSYRLSVPAKGFSFGRYRAEQQEIELDGNRPLRALDGALSLDLAGIDDVAFQASPGQVRDWNVRKAAGELSLVVQFRPSGEPLSWQIETGAGPVAAADEDGAPVEVGPPRIHTMRIERVALDLEQPLDDARERLAAAQPALDRCARGVRRTGAMVVTFAVQGGRLRDVQVVMDALRDETVASCVAQALSGAQLRGIDTATGRGTASIALQ